MLDVKLNTNDNFSMGFVCLRPTAPESGALTGRHHRGELRTFCVLVRATAARRRAYLQLYGRYANKPCMCDVKLNTNDTFSMGFVCLRLTAPESGASARRHHRGELRTFRVFVRPSAARRRA